MKRLFLFELHKLKKQKSLYICSAVVLALLFLMVLANFILYKYLEVTMQAANAVEITLSAINSSDFNLIVSIFIVLYVCGDFGYKTIKNIYSRGFSRTEVFFAKYIICVAYVVIMFIVTELFALAMGSAFFGYRTVDGHVFWSVFGQLLVCLAYASFVFAISFMVKKMGIAFAVVILAPAAITVITTVIDVIIMVNAGETMSQDSFMFSEFWLDGMLVTLSNATASTVKTVLASVLPVVYGAVFVTAGYLVNRKTEV